MASPRSLASVVIKAISSSKSIALLGPNTGLSLPGGRVCPLGLRTGMSEGIIDELLPWYPTGKCNQFGIKALSLPRNMVPTLVACSRLA